jgi:hypothetical protein
MLRIEGVYAKQRIIAGDYIGEYTGQVLFDEDQKDPYNRFLANFAPNKELEVCIRQSYH